MRSRTLRCVLAGLVPVVAILACTDGAGGPADAGRAHVAKGSPWAVACMATQTAAADAGPGSGSDGGTPLPDAGPGSGSDGGTPSPDAGTGSGSGSDGGMPMMDCKGLDIVESMISFEPMGSGTAHVASIPGFTDQLVSASISGVGFAFSPMPGCSAAACDFSAMPKLLAVPFALPITCTATDGIAHTAVLTVQGAQGPSDTDSAILSCSASTNQPLLGVAPSALDAGTVAVGSTKDLAFTVTNNGTATLTYSIAFAPLLPEWTAPGSACIAPAMCAVMPGGSAMVGVRFAPATHGSSATSVSVTSNGGSASIGLSGAGVGSRIAVTDPADGDLDFGTIPRNSPATRTISVTAIGNLPVSLDAAGPGAPFTVMPPSLALSPGTPQEITVGCSSSTATQQLDRVIGLASPNAYALDTPSIAVHCEVANTELSVTPSAFDFMEVRKGSPRRSLPFTISNPGPFPATVMDVRLSGAPAPLSLGVDGGFPRTLPVGDSITGRLDLETGEDVDLAQAAPELKIAVDGEQLAYPVTGKVTTPSAYVTPEKLELGTACAGTQVTGTVMMINNGTARLAMERPEMDESFVPRFESPTSYPAPLLAGTTATLGVSPAAQVPGPVSATLTWAVDAPRSPFVIPVSLDYIESGTAVSPASVSVPAITIGETSNRYTVTLQNCNAAPVMVTIDGVVASRGDAAAWEVQPRVDARTLAPQDKLTLNVAFAPKRHGRHVAQIRLGIDGEERFVNLEGDGIDPDFERTSFYACGCSSRAPGREPAGGWPIVIAVAAVALRRRRRRS